MTDEGLRIGNMARSLHKCEMCSNGSINPIKRPLARHRMHNNKARLRKVT